MGLLDLSLIRILPLDEDDFDVYPLFYPLYEEMRDLFSSERVLPVKDGKGYTKAANAVIARSNRICDCRQAYPRQSTARRCPRIPDEYVSRKLVLSVCLPAVPQAVLQCGNVPTGTEAGCGARPVECLPLSELRRKV